MQLALDASSPAVAAASSSCAAAAGAVRSSLDAASTPLVLHWFRDGVGIMAQTWCQLVGAMNHLQLADASERCAASAASGQWSAPQIVCGDVLPFVVRLLGFALMLALNATMVSLFVRALKSSGSLISTILSSSTNFAVTVRSYVCAEEWHLASIDAA